MLMPIVSMNKMAMNESVATTCCYRQVATPTATYWEVLNGGWIGSGYVDSFTLYPKYNVSSSQKLHSSWKNIKYDVSITDPTNLFNNRVSYVSGTESKGTTAGNAAGWYVFSLTDPTKGTVLEDWLVANSGRLITGKTCDHKTATDCIYGKASIGLKENQHFESKSAHDTGDWKVPHNATQFAS